MDVKVKRDILSKVLCFLLSGTFIVGNVPFSRAAEPQKESKQSGISSFISNNPSSFAALFGLTAFIGVAGVVTFAILAASEHKENKNKDKRIKDLTEGETEQQEMQEPEATPKFKSPESKLKITSTADTNSDDAAPRTSPNNSKNPPVNRPRSNSGSVSTPKDQPLRLEGKNRETYIDGLIVRFDQEFQGTGRGSSAKSLFSWATAGYLCTSGRVSDALNAFKREICELYYQFNEEDSITSEDELKERIGVLASKTTSGKKKLNVDEEQYIYNWITTKGDWKGKS